jgi:TolB-like protein
MTKIRLSIFSITKLINPNFYWAISIALFISFSSNIFAQGTIQKKTFAVLEFDGTGVPDRTMQDITDRFAKEYSSFKKNQFIIINRAQMRRTLQEQNIKVFGCSTFKCGLEAGKSLDVDYIVIGSLVKNGPVYSLKSQLIDVKRSKTISRADYDNIIGDIISVMDKEVKKAAAYLASAKIEVDPIKAKEGPKEIVQKLLILPIEITLDQSFEQEKISTMINEWIRGEVIFSEKANLVDFEIEKSIMGKEEFKNGVISNQVAKNIGLQNEATHIITWTLRVTELKANFILNHFSIVDKPESVFKENWLSGGLRVRFSTKNDIDEMKMNVRKYTWPVLGAAPPTGRFPNDGFFARIWNKIRNAIDSFLFYIENAYGMAAVILILLLLSGFGLYFGYQASQGDDPGPEIGFPPEY